MRTSTIVSTMFALCILLLGLVGCMAHSINPEEEGYIETELGVSEVLDMMMGKPIVIETPGQPKVIIWFKALPKPIQRELPRELPEGPF